MKTTVRNIMMSLVLMGGMILTVPVSAQHSSSRERHSGSVRTESRSSSSRSESRPQVSRSETRSSSVRSESRPQVNRSESRSQVSRTESRRSEARPQMRTETRTEARKIDTPSSQTRTAVDRNRGGNVKPDRGGNDRGDNGGNVQDAHPRQIYSAPCCTSVPGMPAEDKRTVPLSSSFSSFVPFCPSFCFLCVVVL